MFTHEQEILVLNLIHKEYFNIKTCLNIKPVMLECYEKH